MKIKKILVVYKKSAYQVYAKERKDSRFLGLLRKKHLVVQRILPSHQRHQACLKLVEQVLKKRGIQAKFLYRARKFDEAGFDLILTVGGDGTFLEASHRVIKKPILGVNSNPQDSIGMFCGFTCFQLDRALSDIEKGKMKPIKVIRLKVKLGKTVLPILVLNDILITHTNPASMSRYVLRWRGKEEEHKSSGIWVSTPAGSTAAIRGAGGTVMPFLSKKFQFAIRELYQPIQKRNQMMKGVLHSKEQLVIISKMRAGRIYLDGSHLYFPFPIGERVAINTDAPKIAIYGLDRRRRKGV